MFTYPVLLWFLPVLGVVILIHIINLRRHRRIEWAAMEFLLASYQRNKTRLLLQQLLLLLLRLVAIAAVVLLFAGFNVQNQFFVWLSGQSVHHIILLDDSYSMNDRDTAAATGSVFGKGVAAIRQIAAGKNSDTLTLITSNPNPPLEKLVLNHIGLEALESVLTKLAPSDNAVEPETLLERAVRLAQQTAVRSRTTVYLLSDYRRRNWEQSAKMLKSIEAIRQRGASVRLIRLCDTEHPNLSVEKLELVDGIHAADVDMLLDVSVANYGGEAKNVALTLLTDGKPQSQHLIPSIPPNGRTQPPLRLPVRIRQGDVPHRIEVQLQPDAVPNDNQRFMVLQVPDAVNVLLITPEANKDDAQYVRLALSPESAKSGIRVRAEPPSYLTNVNALNGFQAVCFLDVPALEASALKELKRFIENGGGAAFFLGANSDLDYVKTNLAKDVLGVLPLGEQTLAPDFLSGLPDVKVSPHPAFRLFDGQSVSLLNGVRVEKYTGIEKPNDAVKVIAQLRDGSPLVVEKTVGGGKTITFLTTAAPVWNNWGRGNPSYVVVLLELVAYLAKPQHLRQNLVVGETWQVNLDPAQFTPSVRWTPPAGSGKSPDKSEASAQPDGTLHANLPDTAVQGFYEAVLTDHTGKETRRLAAVNVDANEGDIRLADISELADTLATIHQPLENADSFQTSSVFSDKHSLNDYLLGFIILALMLETFLAGRILPPLKRTANKV
ncbi:membrane protein [Planctomycetales bacterium]|nr:membrane protein [Planctomycetales bacterium]